MLTEEVTQFGRRGVHGDSFNAVFSTNAYVSVSSIQADLLSPENREAAFDFCYTYSAGYCKIMTFMHFDIYDELDS